MELTAVRRDTASVAALSPPKADTDAALLALHIDVSDFVDSRKAKIFHSGDNVEKFNASSQRRQPRGVDSRDTTMVTEVNHSLQRPFQAVDSMLGLQCVAGGGLS